jgi:protein-tyrosine phosphatase
VTIERHLEWSGCYNARDLGGLPTTAGTRTRHGALVRADRLDRLTRDGWAAVHAYGIRTVVELRNPHEIGTDAAPRPPGVVTVNVAIDDVDDTAFWERCWADELDGSPLFYEPFLRAKPERCVAALKTIARAAPGGVAFHCGRGRDRAGLVAVMLLALAGASPEVIADDYELSAARLTAYFADSGEEDEGPLIAAILQRKGTTARALITGLLQRLDLEAHLRSAGLDDGDVGALRARLL